MPLTSISPSTRAAVARPLPVPAAAAIPGPAARPQAAAAPVLRLEAIDLSFGGIRALTGIDLDIAQGEIRAVIGPNGAGKSSLVNVISGLYRPDRGRIWLDGRAFGRIPTSRLAAFGVARTFQNLALFKGLSVRDNVVLGRIRHIRSTFAEQIAGLGRARRELREAREHADEIIAFTGLDDVADRAAGTLPYGLQKRVELARALVARPRLLLLDEPFAGMTVTDKGQMARLIRAARDRWGATVVFIEHDIGIVLGLSDRIAVLDYGRKIADGLPADIRDDPVVIDAYLGVDHEDDDADASLSPAAGNS